MNAGKYQRIDGVGRYPVRGATNWRPEAGAKFDRIDATEKALHVTCPDEEPTCLNPAIVLVGEGLLFPAGQRHVIRPATAEEIAAEKARQENRA